MRLQTISLKRARRMRQALSPKELALWAVLKGRQLGGYAFRRQHPIEPFILDFYCEIARLAVEVGGSAHGTPDNARYDQGRDEFLKAKGIDTLRISAALVIKDRSAALTMILDEVRRRAPSVTS